MTTNPTVSPSRKKKMNKKQRTASGYAPPSKYASQPNLLTDCLGPNLLVLFIGVNPGLRTASTGHAYAHPSNLFWKLLHSSGCTPRRCFPHEDHDLPARYHLGNTNIVTRQTKDASELSRAEMDAGVDVLAAKIGAWKPEAVALVGKGIWEAVWRVRVGRAIRKEEFRYGWQEAGWKGARVFVATTTSALAVGMRLAEKEEVWRGLGEWVVRRRGERESEGMVEREVEEDVKGGMGEGVVRGEIDEKGRGEGSVVLDAVGAGVVVNGDRDLDRDAATSMIKMEEDGGTT